MSVNYPVAVAIIVGSTIAIWKGSDWLEGASEQLSRHYGLPAVVQGAIVTAIGSSFPELASVVFAGLAGSLEIGVGAIVGSAIFNILVVPAMAGIATEEPIDTNRALVYKEAQFYMLAVSVLLLTFAFAVIYYPVPSETLDGEVTRGLAVIPLAMYALYIFIQFQDTSDHDAEEVTDVDVRKQWALLAAGLIVILIAVERLVHEVELIGLDQGLSQFLLGVTIVAGATSLPDTLVSVRAARDDQGVASLANVLGSNTFDLLVAIPVGIMLVGSTVINFSMAAPMFGALTAATILLFTALRTGMRLTEPESYVLVVAYFAFLAWVLLEVTNTIVGVLPK